MVNDMMTYDVQFKCYLPEIYVCRVPVIGYRYKQSNKVFWEKKDTVAIDHFASMYWGKEFYSENLNDMDTYNRMLTIREIIDKKYGGSLKNYVRAMVKFEIMSDLIDREEELDTLEISLSFVTNGWEHTTVRVKRKEHSNEKPDRDYFHY